MRSRPDKTLEFRQSVRDSIAQMHKRWNAGPMSEKFDIAKEYINGRIGIVVELDTHARSHSSDPRPTIWPNAEGAIYYCGGGGAVWVYELEEAYARHSGERRQNGVLLDIIEQMQSVKFLARPSFVSREGDKEFLRVVAGRFYSVTRGFVVDQRSPSRKGKPAVLCTSIQRDQFPNSVIEGDSEVMNGVSEDQGYCGGDLLIEVNVDSSLLGLRIAANAKRIAVSLHESVKSSFEIADVLFGPF